MKIKNKSIARFNGLLSLIVITTMPIFAQSPRTISLYSDRVTLDSGVESKELKPKDITRSGLLDLFTPKAYLQQGVIQIEEASPAGSPSQKILYKITYGKSVLNVKRDPAGDVYSFNGLPVVIERTYVTVVGASRSNTVSVPNVPISLTVTKDQAKGRFDIKLVKDDGFPGRFIRVYLTKSLIPAPAPSPTATPN